MACPSLTLRMSHFLIMTKLNCRELMQVHLTKECRKVLRRCEIGCGRKILLPDMKHHVGYECPKRELVKVAIFNKSNLKLETINATHKLPNQPFFPVTTI